MNTSLAAWRRIGEGAPRLGLRARGVRGFLAWWGRSLLAWLPRGWRATLGLDRGRLLLQADGDAVLLRLEDGDGLRDLARLPEPAPEESSSDVLLSMLAPAAHDLPRWLLLPAAVALRRRMPLPAAAADRLRDVVGFEIERQTPFAADAVAFDARVLGRREGDGQIDAELVAVPRAALDTAQRALGDLAGGLAGIDVLGGDGVPLGVNLLDPAQRRRQADPLRAWNLALAVVAVVALAATLWQLLQNRRAAGDAFEQAAASRVEAARQVSARRQALVDTVEGQAFLDRMRAGRPTAVEVLDDLSRRLPDGTYIEKFAIESDRITLIGRSNEASALIGRLEGSKLWRNPALTGALQPDPRTGRDIFTLTAELAVAATASPDAAEARRAAGQ